MAILEVKVFQSLFGTSCVNTFHYTTQSVPAAVSLSFGLTAAMGFVDGVTPQVDDLYGDWKLAVSDQLQFDEVQVRAVYDVTDFYTLPLVSNNTGAVTGKHYPTSVCYPVQSSRVRQDIRRGNRRFAGVVDLSVNNDGVLTAAQVTKMEAVAAAMTTPLAYDDEGNTLSYTPVVISKEAYLTPSGNTAYKYYADEASQLNHLATGILWTPKDRTSTQTSRKYGRGV